VQEIRSSIKEFSTNDELESDVEAGRRSEAMQALRQVDKRGRSRTKAVLGTRTPDAPLIAEGAREFASQFRAGSREGGIRFARRRVRSCSAKAHRPSSGLVCGSSIVYGLSE
jgi:hypothetical protein